MSVKNWDSFYTDIKKPKVKAKRPETNDFRQMTTGQVLYRLYVRHIKLAWQIIFVAIWISIVYFEIV